ncbi:MAG: ribosome-associated GTPase EngA [Candidatus Methylacidiphilales bacterium]
MTSSPSSRTVALVGRPNVGKSALFNRLAGRSVSIVHDRPGVTRDRLMVDIFFGGHPVTLVDTGGIGLGDAEGFDEAIRREVDLALASACAVIFVVDGREGIHVLDREVARLLRKANLPVYVAANKLDLDSMADQAEAFRPLGFAEIFPISAAHGVGIRDLVERVTAGWSEAPGTVQREIPVLKVAFVGVPNAGKSALVNSLLGQDRVIVSPVAGTTRDSVDVPFTVGGESWCLIDTAGMRKRARVHDLLEAATTSRTAHAINRSDLCVLVLDAVRGVGVQEKKIAGLIREAGKACVIFVNKWDLAEAGLTTGSAAEKQAFREHYEQAVRHQLFFLDYAPMVFGSALESKGGRRLLARLEEVRRARSTQVGTGVLNRLLLTAQRARPLKRVRGGGGKIFYGTQLRNEELPCPTFALFVNRSAAWDEAYGRYLEGLLRKKFSFVGCPIRWEIRERKSSSDESDSGRERRAVGLSED